MTWDDPEQITIPPDGRPAEAQPAWRRDFPIDWPRDHYVARRDFTKFMVLTSLAFVVGQVWIGVRNAVRRSRGVFPIRRVAATGEVPIGASLLFHYPGPDEPCVLVRPAAGVWLAYSQLCTHLSCAVLPRVAEGVFFCPCHDGYFDLNSGRPIAGPPRRPLPRITLEVRGGAVYATGVQWRTV